MYITLSSVADAAYLARYCRENFQHLSPWQPTRGDGFHEVGPWAERLEAIEEEHSRGQSAYFHAYNDNPRELIAQCALTGIVHGAFQACFMGYSVAKKYEGQGYMKALCQHVIDYAFTELMLNRIMANYMPCNVRSQKLLESLGFKKEGLAKNYLHINGQWEDHVLTSLLNPQPPL